MGFLLFIIGGGITLFGVIGILAFPLMGLPMTVIGVMILLAGLSMMGRKNNDVIVINKIKEDDSPVKTCPQCAESIKEQAKVCRYCDINLCLSFKCFNQASPKSPRTQ